MSKIGRKAILLPEGVSIKVEDNQVSVSGPSGNQKVTIQDKISVREEDGKIFVGRKADNKQAKAAHGLTRALIANAVKGVKEGYEKNLEIVGVGYKATVENNVLKLKVGFSHEVEIKTPEGIEFEVKKNIITVKGIDKQLVGQTAANIRSVKKPEPYKGKGIKYVGEKILRKVGKAVKGATGA